MSSVSFFLSFVLGIRASNAGLICYWLDKAIVFARQYALRVLK